MCYAYTYPWAMRMLIATGEDVRTITQLMLERIRFREVDSDLWATGPVFCPEGILRRGILSHEWQCRVEHSSNAKAVLDLIALALNHDLEHSGPAKCCNYLSAYPALSHGKIGPPSCFSRRHCCG